MKSFSKNENGYTLSSYYGGAKKLVIPKFHLFKPVTAIDEYAFMDCENLTSVVIPNSITTIEEHAFAFCDGLVSIEVDEKNKHYKSIEGNLYSKDGKTLVAYAKGKTDKEFVIPNSVTTIGNSAFLYCENLTRIEIPNSVTTIEEDAFEDCKNITRIELPNSVTTIGGYAFDGCENLKSVVISKSVTTIEKNAFAFCGGLTSIEVDENNEHYKSIDGNLYTKDGKILIRSAPCKADKKFVIPNHVTTIGEFAFYDCENLTSIEIPNSVTTIEEYAFAHCSGLTSIELPNSVTAIEYSAFEDCKNLTSIVIPNSVTTIGNRTFKDCENLVSIELPNSVTAIGEDAFYACENLTSIVIPNSVTTIEEYAFAFCGGLTSIEVDENNEHYKSIDGSLYTKDGKVLIKYAQDKATKEFVIPNSVTTIGECAFAGCENLTSIVIPNSVTSIGDYAFGGCENLESIVIPNSVTAIGYDAFDYHCCKIYCEAPRKPSGWDKSWKSRETSVVWGYKPNN